MAYLSRVAKLSERTRVTIQPEVLTPDGFYKQIYIPLKNFHVDIDYILDF